MRVLLTPILVMSIASGWAFAEPAKQQDHILLIAIDDLNDWVGCLSDRNAPIKDGTLTGQGHPQASTPNIDRLAKRGVLFTNAHCQAPICRPSRTSFMSGLRPSTTGIYANATQYDAHGKLTAGAEIPWMTKRFEQVGYEVFTAGKILHGSSNKPLGGTPCFKTNQGPFPKQKITVPKEVTPAPIWDIGAYPETEEEYTDLRIARWTADNIRKPLKQGDSPRFMALGFYNPHLPLFAPKKWFDAAPARKDVILGAIREDDCDDLPDIAKRISSRVSYQSCVEWSLGSQENLRTLTQAYLACTSAMDGALGEVIDALDRSDMAENTWIVVLSDHGWHLGEKHHVAKQTLWTRSTRIPMIIVPPTRLKELPRGERCDQAVELLDIYPTLVEATGLAPAPTDAQLEGVSLLPWVAKPTLGKERPAITTIYSHNNSIVDERWRYICYADGSEELYDRKTDPNEFDNLMPKTKDNQELAAVISRLRAWTPEYQAGEPDPVNDPKHAPGEFEGE